MTATTSSRPAVRLTRRGRGVLVLLIAVLLLTVFSLGRTETQAAGGAASQAGLSEGAVLQQTTVQPGESLWSVAQRIAPENDPREVIAQIRRLNDLPGSQLQVGQQLLLPVAS